jgi:peptidoglycan/LPS O-acetylase OafA/YrhL
MGGTETETNPVAGSGGAASAPEGSGGARLDYIDGLRGLAVGMVLVYHAWLFSGALFPAWWNPCASGYLGVDLFLLLSGFCLYRPFVERGRERPGPTLGRFLARRARRLLPPYYVALALFTLLALTVPSYPEGPFGGARPIGRAFLWHLLLLHNLRPGEIATLAGQFWTLALEAQLYLAMPILVVAARRFGIGRAVGLAAAVSLAYRAGLNWYVGGTIFWAAPDDNASYDLLANCVAARWPEFALGMWAADLVATRREALRRGPWGLLSALFLITGVWVSRKAVPLNVLEAALFGFGFFCLLLRGADAGGPRSGGAVCAALRLRPLVGLGMISYSVYLLHQPLLLMAVQASRPYVPGSGPLFALCLGVFTPVVIGLSCGFYRLFERPFLNTPVRYRSGLRLPSPAQAVVTGRG